MNSVAPDQHLLTKVNSGTPLFATERELWDNLVSRSSTNSIFSSSAWLRSWLEVADEKTDVITISAWQQEKIVGAVALTIKNQQLSFAAAGYVDYSDFIIDQSVSDSEFENILLALLNETKIFATSLNLSRIPSVSRTAKHLPFVAGWHLTETAKTEAPIMDMQFVADRLKKKSIVRHTKKLSKLGELTCATTIDADETKAELEAFFAQHVARWEQTSFPSLFNDEHRRAFYRVLTENLAANKSLRFSTIKLDGRLIAAHFGFYFAGVFTWYKPSYDPEFSRYSPGEVLLKHLFERAIEDQTQYFDFTIGGEAFKFRFASETRHVLSYHLTASRTAATKRRLRLAASRLIKN